MNQHSQFPRFHHTIPNRTPEVESEFRMSFVGGLLIFLIILLVCMIIWMLIRCVRGMVREGNRDTGVYTIHGRGRNWVFQESRL